MLNLHNKYRVIHNAAPMTLNCVMGERASEYAKKMADLDSLVPSGYTERPGHGENLSMGCGVTQGLTAEQAVKRWCVLAFLHRVLCCVVLFCSMLCCAVLYYAVMCYAVLCCAVLCCACWFVL